MHDVEIPGGRWNTQEDSCSHTDDSDFYPFVSKPKENLSILRIFEFHGEAE